jgi:aminoglycoside phosphotransferase (APT) family kinase protein
LLRDECRDPGLRIAGLRRLTGGASRETWSFDAIFSDGTELPLILRRDPPGLVRSRGMAAEAAALRAAMDAGVPEPVLLVHDDDPAALGAAFMIMERIEGETIARRILREPDYAPARGFLARQCGEILARIHSIDRSNIPGLVEPDALACTALLEAIDEPHPVLDLAGRWLLANRPPATGRRGVVHGDFRNGNLIIGPEGVRAVLDWEIVHWGDPAEDLGWMCVKAWRFGANAAPAGGFGSYEQLLEGYVAAGGVEVSIETVKWWEILGTLRWGLGCIQQSRRHLDGTVRSVELAAIGRRTCEQEWDLLNLIGERS